MTMIDTAAFGVALGAVKPAVTGQRTFVKLESDSAGLVVAADDATLAIRSTVKVLGGPLDATPLIPHRPLAEFVAKAEAPEVNLSMDGDMLVVTDGDASLALATMTDTWFPTRVPPGGDPVEVPPDKWDRIVGLCQFCSSDQAKGVYTGVHFDEHGASATDSYMLAAVDADFGLAATIPASILKAVNADDGTVTVRTGATVEITCGQTVYQTSPLGGQFMEWRSKIADDFPVAFTVDAAQFCRAVDRAALLGVDSPTKLGRHVRVAPVDDKMMVESIPDTTKGDSRSKVTEVIGVDVTGTWDWHFGIATGPVAALRSILGKPETITFGTGGNNQPLIVRTDDTMVLIQPVRTQ